MGCMAQSRGQELIDRLPDVDLVVGTHGRSIWIFDNLGPLEQLTDAALAEDLHLFDFKPATMWRLQGRSGFTGHRQFLAPNPPNGAVIDYYLKAKPDEKERVRVTISDKDGKVVRELDGTKEPGINRVVWNLRTRSVTEAPREPGEAAESPESAEQPGGGGAATRAGMGATGSRA